MAELETALRQLGHEVAFPPTPDLASAIRGRLERPQRFWRRPAAIALAVLVVAAIAAVLAVPQSRSAILDWLGLRNVSVVRVEKLPAVPAQRPTRPREPDDPRRGRSAARRGSSSLTASRTASG